MLVWSSAGLQDGLIRLCQDLVADLGVGDRPVFLAQVKTQLALVAEVEVALLALRNKEEISGVRQNNRVTTKTEVRLICSGLVGLTHRIRLLSGVDAQMALQGLQVAEAGAAGVAGVRLLTCVDQDVGPEVGHLQHTNKPHRYDERLD